MKSASNKPRAGAVRKGRKGPQVASGGQGRQALEGRKPTPKAEDRPYHPAGKRKAAAERYEAAGGKKTTSRNVEGAARPPQQQRKAKTEEAAKKAHVSSSSSSRRPRSS